ncbi:MAG: HAD family hydrolase [Sedimentisphaerales bacterium]|nr:HAD family hydrolase [Sedimentisphaerales bacterium]
MPAKKIRAVLFDLGDTLLNFGKVQTISVFRQSARLTYDYLVSCGQPVNSFKWYSVRSLITIRLRCLWSCMTGRDFDALSLLKKMGIKWGSNLSQQQWQHLGWLWYEPLSKLAKVEPDIKDTLSALRRMGLKLGILSNTFISTGSLDKHLAELGILNFFPYRLYSYQFEFRKPDKRIFEAAIAKMDEPAEGILFVGDRLDKDIRPALKAGMQAALKAAYTNMGKKVPNGVCKINKIAELPSLIEKINAEIADSI